MKRKTKASTTDRNPKRERRAWVQIARERFKEASRRGTDRGQFAVLAPCRVATYTLHKTEQEAEGKASVQCGGQCSAQGRASRHRIVDLAMEVNHDS